ncbi:MAG: glycosyltransferase [Methyloprofundus sp.]|nr:glycosyltransferase [Methyloprofundus sp.]
MNIFRTNRGELARSHLDVLNIPQIRLSKDLLDTDADIPDADVVVATYWKTAREVLALSPRKGAKAYFLQHYEVVFVGSARDEVNETWTYPMRKIVVAPWLKELAELEFGDSSAILVPNGVNTAQFTAPPRQKNTRPTVGFVFSHPGFKGSDIAIDAFELLRREIPNFRLVSFGASWRRSLKNGPSLPKGTEYQVLPPQNRIPEIYTQCDVWVCASRSEGFGLPMLEAMACRTPVISTPTGIAPLLAEQGGLRLVAHEDPSALACEIQRILELSADDWSGLSQQAHTTAQKFDLETAALQFESALEMISDQQ